jgi:AGZA family xanthine/uracil permease-like MFS transporter
LTSLDALFDLKKHGSSARVESIGGLTTFLAMAYITVVNPSILSEAGMDFGAVFVATCIAAAFGSIVMGLYANYPIAQAPGMGQNAFFTFGVVLGMGHNWQTALGAVFVSGVIFVAMSVLPIREWLVNSIPRNLKLGMAAGIGLFLGFIALRNAGIVVGNPATLVGLGRIWSFEPIVCIVGFVTIAALSARKVTGAVIIGHRRYGNAAVARTPVPATRYRRCITTFHGDGDSLDADRGRVRYGRHPGRRRDPRGPAW